MYDLYIANKNYSSWSLRPWIVMRMLDIPFNEILVPFGDHAESYARFSPTGKVPCLLDQAGTVWDSLSIVEYLAERHEGVWAKDARARAWSRSASAEMHSSFQSLRDQHPMNLGIRVQANSLSPSLSKDIARIDALWQEGLETFGGPFLGGENFTAVDGFFTPVAFRFQTYGTRLSAASEAYKNRLLALPAVKEWEAAALKETWRDEEHEEDSRRSGTVTDDLRASA